MVIDTGNNFSANNAANKARQSSSSAGANATTSNTVPNDVKTTGDSVSLSDTGKTLALLEARVATQSDVDLDKVESIKTAIGNGSYTIDDSAIAGALLEQDATL